MFGNRPSIADFALWGHIYNANNDVTARELIQKHVPKLNNWIERMEDPKEMGDFETWLDLKPTLFTFDKGRGCRNFFTLGHGKQ